MIAKTRTHFLFCSPPLRIASIAAYQATPLSMRHFKRMRDKWNKPIMHVFLRIKKEVPLGETSFPY
ncbi:hypothetical protein [Caenibacillus caldisaponilyticus]|uniref:hypothetical protein n=1 Tax=Caenibacillus caldisaponilyticus TaxID=1674942 RepID=UPI0009883CA5|nr:hypothetical protein [Caenibacillus caldisaponilyticus]